MVEWAGQDGAATASRYPSMAERELRGVSPSYERICVGIADDAELITLLDTLPADKRQPNLLLGAVRFLGGIAPVQSYPSFRDFVRKRWAELSRCMLARRTQTNEPRRCATLLPALAALRGPLALLEVGASAGLCLYPDRYAYRYDCGSVIGGPAAGTAPVLECATRGPVPVPVPDRVPQVAWRAGLDLNPLDVHSEQDVRWLHSLVWPEQSDRMALLTAAVSLAQDYPAPVHRGDLCTDLAAIAATAPPGLLLVVFHSAVLAYLTKAQRAAFRTELSAIAASRPLVWLANEGPGVVVDLTVPNGPTPFVLARDGVALATASPHGEWLSWLPG